jgi:hypothetical protein
VQTQRSLPSSYVDDTVKCRHSLPCRHHMWMTPSSADTAFLAVIICGWHCQVQTQRSLPSSNVDDTVKCRHSVLCHHQILMTLSSADTATIIKHGWHISRLLFHFPFIFIVLLRHSSCSNINICIILKSYPCSLLNINYPIQIIVSPGLIFTSVNT